MKAEVILMPIKNPKCGCPELILMDAEQPRSDEPTGQALPGPMAEIWGVVMRMLFGEHPEFTNELHEGKLLKLTASLENTAGHEDLARIFGESKHEH